MTDNIKSVQFRPEVNEELVEHLEAMLRLAKAGDLTTGYFFGYNRAECLVTTIAPSNNRLRDLAGAERIKHRINLSLDMGTEDLDG